MLFGLHIICTFIDFNSPSIHRNCEEGFFTDYNCWVIAYSLILLWLMVRRQGVYTTLYWWFFPWLLLIFYATITSLLFFSWYTIYFYYCPPRNNRCNRCIDYETQSLYFIWTDGHIYNQHNTDNKIYTICGACPDVVAICDAIWLHWNASTVDEEWNWTEGETRFSDWTWLDTDSMLCLCCVCTI